MSGWLSNISERSCQVDRLEESLKHAQTAYVVLDQRRSPEQCRSLLSLSGKRDFLGLFAGTPLSPLLEASPWLLDIDVGSEAWRYAEKLCQQRLGWVCQPQAEQTLHTVANHLRPLFVMDDSLGGKSLINLQQPAVLTALLASAPANTYSHWSSPLNRLATPTPQGQWLIWKAEEPTSPAPEQWQLTAETEAALKESQQAWWLSRMQKVPLGSLPEIWLVRMQTAMQAGISRSDHLKRLLPVITDESDTLDAQIDNILNNTHLPSRQKVKQLEQLL